MTPLPELSLAENIPVALGAAAVPEITRDLGVIQRKGKSSSASAHEFIGALRGAFGK